MKQINIGIIICDRYRNCAGGKCLASMDRREGAFSVYQGQDIHLAGYTSCGGCPGGNMEYAPDEMKKNGVSHIHFATGMLVGYPPCPHMDYFRKYLTEKYGFEVIFGTHPIPQKYYLQHTRIESWKSNFWKKAITLTICDEDTRKKYD